MLYNQQVLASCHSLLVSAFPFCWSGVKPDTMRIIIVRAWRSRKRLRTDVARIDQVNQNIDCPAVMQLVWSGQAIVIDDKKKKKKQVMDISVTIKDK